MRTLLGIASLALSMGALADAGTDVGSPVTETGSAAPAAADIQGKHGDDAGQSGWVIVPIPVANPTFGNGLQLGFLYLHAADGQQPPATTGAGAMATDNGTRLVAAFQQQSFMEDRFRMTAIVGGGELAGQFFGIGTGSVFADRPVDYSFKGEVFGFEGLARLFHENWFVGLNLQQIAATITFDASQLAPQLPDVNSKFNLVGLGPELLYDSRDNTTYPTDGAKSFVRWNGFKSSWGRQPSFHKGDVDLRIYRSITKDIVGAARLRYQSASDKTPFFELPSLDLRGVSNDRYRDQRTIMASAEVRYIVLPRWNLLGFVDTGRAASTAGGLRSASAITSYGGAVRWQPSTARRLYLGLDLAFNGGDKTLFIQLGERF